MRKILVGVMFGLLVAAITSGCEVRTEPAVVIRQPVVVRPVPVVVYQPTVVVQQYKYKRKHGHSDQGDQGENEE